MWTHGLAQAAAGIDSWDWCTRIQQALDLRRTFKDLPDDVLAQHDHTIRPVRLVAAWLTQASGHRLVPVTARLADHVLQQSPDDHLLAAAWYATHGGRLKAELTGTPHRDELLAELEDGQGPSVAAA